MQAFPYENLTAGVHVSAFEEPMVRNQWGQLFCRLDSLRDHL